MSNEKKILAAFLNWCYSIVEIPEGDVSIRYYEKLFNEMIQNYDKRRI